MFPLIPLFSSYSTSNLLVSSICSEFSMYSQSYHFSLYLVTISLVWASSFSPDYCSSLLAPLPFSPPVIVRASRIKRFKYKSFNIILCSKSFSDFPFHLQKKPAFLQWFTGSGDLAPCYIFDLLCSYCPPNPSRTAAAPGTLSSFCSTSMPRTSLPQGICCSLCLETLFPKILSQLTSLTPMPIFFLHYCSTFYLI